RRRRWRQFRRRHRPRCEARAAVNHRPRRRFGQHFLESDAILEAMAERLAFSRDDEGVEIGPGEGALTRHLIGAPEHVRAVEIDRDLVALLRARYPTLRVVEGDVLRVDLGTLTTAP